jgi:hypothetical protein
MKRKVLAARLHDMKFVIEGIGQIPVTLPPTAKALPGLKMWADGSELLLEIAGKEYGIPLANCMLISYAPAEPVAVVAAPKVVAKA